jgi:type II secretory pathway pseudopilin PulG
MSFITNQPGRPGSRSHRPRRRGFTLIEAAMTTAIIGMGVVALMELLASGSVVNVRGTETTTAMNLAKNIRERTIQAPFDTLVGLNGQNFQPPIDSRGIEIPGLPEWRQDVAVQVVDPNRLTATSSDPSPQAVRVTARISRNARVVTELSWYCMDGAP